MCPPLRCLTWEALLPARLGEKSVMPRAISNAEETSLKITYEWAEVYQIQLRKSIAGRAE
jgi:hypothetical protein